MPLPAGARWLTPPAGSGASPVALIGTSHVSPQSAADVAIFSAEAAGREAAFASEREKLARDAEEGINAFIEKRDPTWEDR